MTGRWDSAPPVLYGPFWSPTLDIIKISRLPFRSFRLNRATLRYSDAQKAHSGELSSEGGGHTVGSWLREQRFLKLPGLSQTLSLLPQEGELCNCCYLRPIGEAGI